MGSENLVARKRFGAEGSLLNKSLKVSGSIGIMVEACLTILVDSGFFIFNSSAMRMLKVRRKAVLPWCGV